MLKQQRFQYILECLRKEGIATTVRLSQDMGVSYMTVWRDLGELERQGMVQRVRGGAMVAGREEVSDVGLFPAFDPRRDPHYEKKVMIGKYAARYLVSDGENITVEAGTTASRLVPYLTQAQLTLLTNGLVTAFLAAAHLPQMTVMCSGGILLETGAFIGPQAEEFFTRFKVNKVFFGAQGLTLEDGFTDPTPLYAPLKRVMRQNAEKVIVLIDSSKIGARSLVQVLPLDEVDVLVTDAAAPKEIVDALRQKGVEVHLATEDLTPA
jgi:DeoR/GlpR family transcriptional regulator of sugar metabolism